MIHRRPLAIALILFMLCAPLLLGSCRHEPLVVPNGAGAGGDDDGGDDDGDDGG